LRSIVSAMGGRVRPVRCRKSAHGARRL